MPLFHWACPVCNVVLRRILDAKGNEYVVIGSCPTKDCPGALKRAPKPPTAQAVETLDNGFMVRRLERPVDAERLYRERAQQDNNDRKDD